MASAELHLVLRINVDGVVTTWLGDNRLGEQRPVHKIAYGGGQSGVCGADALSGVRRERGELARTVFGVGDGPDR